MSGPASGGLVIDRPDRFRLEIYAPIVGPRFYGVSNGEAVNAFVVAQNTWLGGPDAEAALREITGGAAGLKDLVDLLTGRLPFEDAEVVGVEVGEEETVYTFQGPQGTRATVAVDARELTTRRVEAFDTSEVCVLRAEYSDYKRSDRGLMPEEVTITVPPAELEVVLSFRSWEELKEVPDAFSLPAPKGATRLDLVETIRGRVEARVEEP